MSTPEGTASVQRTRKAQSEASISLRISRQALDLIDDAAVLQGKSRTEFMLDCARRQAIDVLLDQRLFVFNEAEHEAFMRVLDNPPAPNDELKRLMRRTPPWKR